MSIKKVAVDESLLNQLSVVYSSLEQGVNSSVAMWSAIKRNMETIIGCSLTKNQCMYMVEFLAKLEYPINFGYDGDFLYEIEDIMICGVYPPDEELEARWGCDLNNAYSAFSEMDILCQYIIVEWAIIYREFGTTQKKAFEKYLDDFRDNKI
ncbi:MAG: hypothetical protein N4A50_04140 [Vallitalea sp.]|jgi:hypothetical protein|nr:hypothetical protein [Vallitalea sp.]